MKKTIMLYLVLLFLGGFYFAEAQNTFAPLGAEWWYQGDNFNYTSWPGGLTEPNKTWTDHVQVVKDTIINKIPCRKVTVTSTYRSGAYEDSLFVENLPDLFVYDNQDTVFVYNETYATFLPLYIFNVSVGDTINLLYPLASIDFADSLYLVVSSVVTETFGDVPLRSVYTKSYRVYENDIQKYTINYGSLYGIHDLESTGKYTERLGMTLPLLSGFFPFGTSSLEDIPVRREPPSGDLVCYKDKEYEIHLTDNKCNFIPMPVSGIKSIKQNVPLNLSPNPAYSQFNIQGDDRMPLGTIVKVYDLSGRVVLPIMDVSAQQKVSIDIRQLPEGLYIVRVEGRGQYSYHKLAVQR